MIRKLVYCTMILCFWGCTIVNSGPHSDASANASSCVVKKEYLNLEYDTHPDYKNADIPTDFFLLVYSNSPDFCRYMRKKGKVDQVPFQCDSPNAFGWVVHGLWGESRSAYVTGQKEEHPRYCKGDLDPVDLDLIMQFLCLSPGTRLLQGEWEKHGACDFESARAYFEKMSELHRLFKLPPADYGAKKAMKWMKANNKILKNKYLHLTDHEFGICFTKEFEVISCPRPFNNQDAL